MRLRFHFTLERKAQFLDQVPHLLDDIQDIDKELGREVYLNWNEVQERVNKVLSSHSSKWRAPEQKFFRAVFAERDTEAAPVIFKRETIKGQKQLTENALSNNLSSDSQQQVIYEPDKELRVFESISLKENVEDYFSREVLPSLSDAWIDHTKDVVGYQINFDSYFYDYVPALQNTSSSSLKSLKYH